MQKFKLAPMDQYMVRTTKFCLLIPVFFFLAGPLFPYILFSGFVILFFYFYIWLKMRPKFFCVDEETLTIQWPIGKRLFRKSDIVSVEYLDRKKFKETYGFGVRVGAGGLWGAFGRYQTTSTTFRLFISRRDAYVIVKFREGKPLMITPENHEAFMKSLSKA